MKTTSNEIFINYVPILYIVNTEVKTYGTEHKKRRGIENKEGS